MRRIQINVQKKINRTTIEKRNEKNISVIKNVFTKWEVKQRKSYVDISDNSQWFLKVSRVSGKD